MEASGTPPKESFQKNKQNLNLRGTSEAKIGFC